MSLVLNNRAQISRSVLQGGSRFVYYFGKKTGEIVYLISIFGVISEAENTVL